jgi:biotin transport system substrate-specific component
MLVNPLYVRADRSIAFKVLAVVLATVLLSVSSKIQVPMIPVPMTLQTLAVTLVGALYGWRLGGVAVLAWLTEGALGMPVFAGATAGVPYLFGPTGGYLFSFPLVAMVVGFLCERGWGGKQVFLAFGAMLIGNALCLAVGAGWLAFFTGAERAVALGVTPFLLGGLSKSVLGAALLKASTIDKQL